MACRRSPVRSRLAPPRFCGTRSCFTCPSGQPRRDGTDNSISASPSSRGLGHDPFTVVTGVRIPLGTPLLPTPATAGVFVCNTQPGMGVRTRGSTACAARSLFATPWRRPAGRAQRGIPLGTPLLPTPATAGVFVCNTQPGMGVRTRGSTACAARSLFATPWRRPAGRAQRGIPLGTPLLPTPAPAGVFVCVLFVRLTMACRRFRSEMW